MNLRKYQHTQNDTWLWRLAEPRDLDNIVTLCKQNYEHEIQGLLEPDEPYYRYQLALAITTQQHHLGILQLTVCVDKNTDKLLAYAWVQTGSTPPYSQTRLAEARVLHLDLELTQRQRMKITVQALLHWQRWSTVTEHRVLVSTTVRQDQQTFMRLHQQLGYTVRGSHAFLTL